MNRASFISQLDEYVTNFSEEQEYIPRFKELLREELCYFRKLLTGHLTASAWILNQEKDAVLMLHHRKLNRWLQPGGHADGEEDLVSVAKKEANEETGIKNLKLFSSNFFDLDIHEIPVRKSVRSHDHFDVRYLFIADQNEPIKKNDESNHVKWIRLDQLEKYVGQERSILRMREKSKSHLKWS